MSKQYHIIFECYESSPEVQQVLSKTVMMAGSVEKPEDVFNFGFAHEEQVKLVHSCQEALLKEQITLIESGVYLSTIKTLFILNCHPRLRRMAV